MAALRRIAPLQVFSSETYSWYTSDVVTDFGTVIVQNFARLNSAQAESSLLELAQAI
jgi:hypothetical protein